MLGVVAACGYTCIRDWLLGVVAWCVCCGVVAGSGSWGLVAGCGSWEWLLLGLLGVVAGSFCWVLLLGVVAGEWLLVLVSGEWLLGLFAGCGCWEWLFVVVAWQWLLGVVAGVPEHCFMLVRLVRLQLNTSCQNSLNQMFLLLATAVRLVKYSSNSEGRQAALIHDLICYISLKNSSVYAVKKIKRGLYYHHL